MRGTIKLLNYRDLVLHKPADPQRVKAIVQQFNPVLVNPVEVFCTDNKYEVHNGVNTLAALREIEGTDDFMVICRVFTEQDLYTWEPM